MFKKGEVVMYPKYGGTKIKRIYKESVNGQDQDYYELSFSSNMSVSNLSISIPVDKAETMGMRYPLPKKELVKALSNLGKKVKLNEEIGFKISDFSKEKLSSGTADDAVELICILQTLTKKRKDINKSLDLNERDNLRAAIDFIRSEILHVLGEKAMNKYIEAVE